MHLALALILAAGAPRDLGLTESAGAELLQVQVVAAGPGAEALRPDSFRVYLDGTSVEGVTADPLAPRPDLPATTGAAYLLYFDQPFLSLRGRARGLALARDLASRWIREGAQVAVVSRGRRLQRFTGLTSDPARVREALDRLEADPDHRVERIPWEDQALRQLDVRIDEALGEYQALTAAGKSRQRKPDRGVRRDGLTSGGFAPRSGRMRQGTSPPAQGTRYEGLWEGMADQYGPGPQGAVYRALEAVLFDGRGAEWDVRAGLIVLRELADAFATVPAPRSIVYFGDTLRLSPADALIRHAEERLRTTPLRAPPGRGRGSILIGGVDASYVLAGLATSGVPILAVQAEGLSNDPLSDSSASALVSLAAQTGGQAFLRGVEADRIALAEQERAGRTWLLSVPAGGLTTGRPMTLEVGVEDPAVRLAHPARVRVPGPTDRVRGRVVRDVVWADAKDLPVGAGLIPTGFRDGRYTALAQARAASGNVSIGLALRGGNEAGGAWEVDVTGDAAAAVAEWPVEVPPGPTLLVASARDAGARIGSAQAIVDWPDPRRGPATILPVSVFQPEEGSFLRDGEVRDSGPRLLGTSDPIDPGRPAALVTLVCRGTESGKALPVQRTLEGQSAIIFEEETLGPGAGCVQFRDVVPPGSLGPGNFLYRVQVLQDGVAWATARRLLRVP